MGESVSSSNQSDGHQIRMSAEDAIETDPKRVGDELREPKLRNKLQREVKYLKKANESLKQQNASLKKSNESLQ